MIVYLTDGKAAKADVLNIDAKTDVAKHGCKNTEDMTTHRRFFSVI